MEGFLKNIPQINEGEPKYVNMYLVGLGNQDVNQLCPKIFFGTGMSFLDVGIFEKYMNKALCAQIAIVILVKILLVLQILV